MQVARNIQEMWTNVTDAECSERLPPSTSSEKLEETRAAVVHENGRVTIAEIAQKLNISQGSLFLIMYNNLCFHKVCAQAIDRIV
jgi:hypothetical protein